MPTALIGFTLAALLSLAQAPPVKVKVENHLLGENRRAIFSEGKEGVTLNACTTKDFGKANPTIKSAKEYCILLSNIQQRMVGGESDDYKDELTTPRRRRKDRKRETASKSAELILWLFPRLCSETSPLLFSRR